jgi:nitrogen regulatory protein PII
MLEVYCSDDRVEELAATIERNAHTGLAGDGIVVITGVERVTRIRTGQTQEEAV